MPAMSNSEHTALSPPDFWPDHCNIPTPKVLYMNTNHKDTSNVRVISSSESILPVKVSQARRLEEYVSLRQEMLQLHTFCRQVLYWTLGFVVLGIGWCMTNTNPKLSAFGFGNVFLISIGLSSYIYFYHQVAISRLSSFIAVFWETRVPGTDLTWHRYNRHGRSHSIGMTLSAIMTYRAAVCAVFFIMLAL
jgi:hypothetical protein